MLSGDEARSAALAWMDRALQLPVVDRHATGTSRRKVVRIVQPSSELKCRELADLFQLPAAPRACH